MFRPPLSLRSSPDGRLGRFHLLAIVKNAAVNMVHTHLSGILLSVLLGVYTEVEWLGGTWVTQSVGRPTSAQVVISQLMSSSPTSGSMLTAQSLVPALDSVFPTLPLPTHTLSFSHSKINIKKIFFKNFICLKTNASIDAAEENEEKVKRTTK